MNSSSLMLSVTTSSAVVGLLNVRDRLLTPGIRYLSNGDLLAFDDSWYEQIETITRTEKHLLTKTREDLEPAARDGRVTIAIDSRANNRVVGCVVLWHLYENWYELGTFLVIPEYRFKSGTRRAMPIGDALYRRLLANNRDKNILGTTTNRSAIRTGQRHGMQMVKFDQLPSEVERATCICPASKMLSDNNATCALKNRACRVRISFPTWTRLGRPTRLSWIDPRLN